MNIEIAVRLKYSATQPFDLLLQIEAAQTAEQKVLRDELSFDPDSKPIRIAGDEAIGERIWLSAESKFECSYNATVAVSRQTSDICQLDQTEMKLLPADVIKYLMSSRYCYLEDFLDFTANQFASTSGGAFITAACDWIKTNFKYAIDASNSSTTATDSFLARKGVCRDYAHVLIAMARSVAIPARFVSAYAPDVDPQDFHAVVEVYLEGKWHLIDPTGMAKPGEIVRIGVGRDATDVAFMTSYGWLELVKQSVQVHRC